MLSIIAASNSPAIAPTGNANFESGFDAASGENIGGFAALLAQLGNATPKSLPTEIGKLAGSALSDTKQNATQPSNKHHLRLSGLVQNSMPHEQGRELPLPLLHHGASHPESSTSDRLSQAPAQPQNTESPEIPNIASAIRIDQTVEAGEAKQENSKNNEGVQSEVNPNDQGEALASATPEMEKRAERGELKTPTDREAHAEKTKQTKHHDKVESDVAAHQTPSVNTPVLFKDRIAKSSSLNLADEAKPRTSEKENSESEEQLSATTPLENPYAGLAAAINMQAPPVRSVPDATAVNQSEKQIAITQPLSTPTPQSGTETPTEQITTSSALAFNQAETNVPESAIIAANESKPDSNALSPFAMTLHSATQSAPKGETASHQSQVPTHVRDPNWSSAFSERVTWLAKNEIQSAEIHLNPPQLGPVHISISLSGDQATASFSVANVEVRQAIENSLPQLRDMLASSGIQLGDTNVGAQSQQQAREQASQFSNGQRSRGEDAILPAPGNSETSAVVAPLNRGRGMVDLFA